ncbi:ketoacyl-ACP synthase III family protein [Saccharopolyspora sp. NPDC050389]|uniref:ketoacyl-ACP synthase III family protein n=1 Tax=Saccharopolyspora sp. NPDC050389 TaxID=3155516 RepID=UPI0033EEBE22
MRWSDIHVKAGAVALGRREDTATAVADGRYDPDYCAAHDYESVCVAKDDELALDLAVDAARRALSRSGVDSAAIKLVVYVSSTPGGPDGIVPASYLQGKAVGAGTASALEVRQTCNGGLAALELAAAYLSAAPAGWSALIATSDKHQLPGAERYRSDPGNLDADGAAALVLSRGNGVARILSTVVLGDGRFSDVALDGPQNYANRQEFLAEQRRRLQPMLASAAALQRESVATALAEAGVLSAEINRWVFANVGRLMVDQEFRKEFGIEESRTTWDWGRTVGHTGTADQFAGLTHLLETGAVHVGDRVALCGNGVGFSHGCAVVDIVDEPEWSADGQD